MDTSVKSEHTEQPQKRGDLHVMHDHTNNSYHSSFYRHQVQTRQHNDRSARTPTTSNENVSCHSPAHALKGSLSPTLAVPAAVSSQQNNHSHTDSDTVAAISGRHDTSIDFKALYNMMDSSSMDTSAAHLHQHDAQDSLGTILYYLNDCSGVAQHFNVMDPTEPISFLRVMYLGIASSEERRLFLKKLSDGLYETLSHHMPSILSTDDSMISMPPRSCRFHERKHHLFPLDLFLASTMGDSNNNNNDLSDTAKFEDKVISIVEADFTADNNDPLIQYDPELILHYIHTHCQHNCSSSILQAILNSTTPYSPGQRAFSDSEPRGIDLCVYFYHDAQDMAQVSEDMGLLWKIGALGIPILPIMSMSQRTPPTPPPPHSATKPPTRLSPNSHRSTNTASQNHLLEEEAGHTKDPYLTQRPIGVRRNELAYLFSLWRIKMMDLSNLDVVGQPSFQSKGKSRWDATDEDRMIERLLGHTWASSSLISPTPYHVLTLHQFMAIDKRAISNLLTTIKDQAKDQRQPMDDDDDDDGSATTKNDNHPTLSTPKTSTTTIPVQMESFISRHSTLDRLGVYIYPSSLFVLLLLLVGFGLWNIVSLVVQYRQASPWRASLIMVSHRSGKSMAFIVNVYNGQDQPTWAPELPLITTNIPLPMTTACRTKSSIWISDDDLMTVMPLPNSSTQQSLQGQYFYSMPLPLCSSLDTSVDYFVQIKPSVIFPSTSTPPSVQGSPLHIPKLVLCGSSRMMDSSLSLPWMDPSQDNIMEAWRHFMQHSRFYLMNSIKIVEIIFTEGKEKD
ncbi:unnamed protein product [Absidia cylindrospora]